MAKYDWKQLEKEYLLSEYKSVSDFLKDKNINNNGTTRKRTSGWKDKKKQMEDKKTTKTIEKIIEKKAEIDAQKAINIKSIATDLALQVIQASKELNKHLARNKTKSKTITYDYNTNKPKKEIIEETEEIKSYIDIIDRQGLKQLTSALKDLNEIINGKMAPDDNDNLSLSEAIQKAYEQKVGDK